MSDLEQHEISSVIRLMRDVLAEIYPSTRKTINNEILIKHEGSIKRSDLKVGDVVYSPADLWDIDIDDPVGTLPYLVNRHVVLSVDDDSTIVIAQADAVDGDYLPTAFYASSELEVDESKAASTAIQRSVNSILTDIFKFKLACKKFNVDFYPIRKDLLKAIDT